MVVCLSWLWQMDTRSPTLKYSQVRQLFEQEKVESFSFADQHTLVLHLREKVEGTDTIQYRVYDVDLFYQDLNDLIVEQKEKGVLTDYDYPPPPTVNWLERLLPYVLMVLALG